MKLFLGFAAFLVLLAVVPTVRAQPVSAFTMLTGRANVPSNANPATGNCSIAINGNAGTFNYAVSNIMNLQIVHAHIGNLTSKDFGVTTAVLVLFTVAPGSITIQGTKTNQGTFQASDLRGNLTGMPLTALGNLITQGQIYCDVHIAPPTAGAPAPSAIRGQFVAQRNGVAPAPSARKLAAPPVKSPSRP